MAVLVYVENSNGKFKKAILEAVNYASKVAQTIGKEAIAISIGNVDNETLASLGNYGVKKVLKVTGDKLKDFDSHVFVKIIAHAAESENAEIVVVSYNYTGKAIAPGLSVKMKAGLVTGVIELPEINKEFIVKKETFSGNAFAYYTIQTDKKILALMPNSIQLEKQEKKAEVVDFSVNIQDKDFGVSIKEVKKSSGKISLTEAEIVVSAGRGLKAPENWGIIEELAKTLGAAIACSRPVSDMEWRPHEEHVGQTGKAIRPNLYIAIAISGAIQHLAGVNGSKVIVVINKDSEAPFFKAADYGIVGDAFEILPKLTEAFKKLKGTL